MSINLPRKLKNTHSRSIFIERWGFVQNKQIPIHKRPTSNQEKYCRRPIYVQRTWSQKDETGAKKQTHHHTYMYKKKGKRKALCSPKSHRRYIYKSDHHHLLQFDVVPLHQNSRALGSFC